MPVYRANVGLPNFTDFVPKLVAMSDRKKKIRPTPITLIIFLLKKLVKIGPVDPDIVNL